MVKRFNRDLYIDPDSYTISFENLSILTKRNILFLKENLGIDFDDFATVSLVKGSRDHLGGIWPATSY